MVSRVSVMVILFALGAAAQQSVDAVTVVSMPVESLIELPAELLPFQQVALRPSVAGKVERILVDRGSRVAEGELLAVVGGSEIRAPFSGVIATRYLHTGALAGPQDTLLDLVQTNRLRLLIAVPEEDTGVLPRGELTFRVPAYPGNAFHATVARNAGALDPKSHALPVEAEVRNTNGRLLPGMRATVSWRALSPQSLTLVPPSAIATSGKRTFVLRLRNGAVEWVDVARGRPSGEMVTVQGSLDAGDLIARTGNADLRPGTRVQPRVR